VAHNCHSKIQFITAKYNAKLKKFKLLPANYKHSRQKQKQLLQIKIDHGKSKSLAAKAKHSRQKQNVHGKTKSRIWSAVVQLRGVTLHNQQDVFFSGLLSVMPILEVQNYVLLQLWI